MVSVIRELKSTLSDVINVLKSRFIAHSFASISLPPNPTKHTTPVSKRTLNPSFPPAQSTFDFPIYRSLVDRLGVLEVVLWDKDFFGVGLGTSKGGVGVGRKEYLGKVALGLEKWFEANEGRALGWHMRKNNSDGHKGEEGCVFELPLVSTRSNTHVRGKVKLRLGFVCGSDSEAERKGNMKETEEEMDFEKVYEELLRSSRPSLVNIPPVSESNPYPIPCYSSLPCYSMN
ncbi:hypothetical protein BT96DRAFT_831124 [Gymnopus androsaceus JB14]|uniref:C2 domain-containing protein n=1 Tax=Gymnopus androsaceus JB14 TaxID=1447944 RepID=A0A6A4H327_9AGAR|nr:hypothetical protein BT96DRAFT_831124 [Gymnopus androsaceus JB14]